MSLLARTITIGADFTFTFTKKEGKQEKINGGSQISKQAPLPSPRWNS